MTDPTPQERREQVVALARGEQGAKGEQGVHGDQGEHGEQGNQGNQGNRGERGELSRPLRRSLVYLFAAAALLAVVALAVSVHETSAWRSSQLRQSQMVEHKLCATLDGLAGLQPPPGNPDTNPSRAYLQGLHLKFTDLGRDLGCG